jgi:2-hydroxy-3-keto-5-methylthiopentenyl-1-phosphate phosphatase
MRKKKSTIALMYDFDKTLCTKDMQEYSFIPSVNMKPKNFWKEATKLAQDKKMDPILAYMFLMLDKAKNAKKPVHREDIVKLGESLEFYAGVDTWFDRMNALAADLDINVEHYVISSGLREIIEGCEIYKKFKEVFACEFFYDENNVACWPKNVVNYTTKTQFLFRINKGVLDLSDDKTLNTYTPVDERPIPFRNMIYIGDGLTDVPCMKLVKVNGGASLAVYKPRQRHNIAELLINGRVNYLAPANYSKGRKLETIVCDLMRKMAMVDNLVIKNAGYLKNRLITTVFGELKNNHIGGTLNWTN